MSDHLRQRGNLLGVPHAQGDTGGTGCREAGSSWCQMKEPIKYEEKGEKVANLEGSKKKSALRRSHVGDAPSYRPAGRQEC